MLVAKALAPKTSRYRGDSALLGWRSFSNEAGLRPGGFIVRAGGLREIDAGGLAWLGNFDSLLMRLLRPLGKGGVRLEQQSGIPRGTPE